MKLLTIKPAKPSVIAQFLDADFFGHAIVTETLEEKLLIERCPPSGWRIMYDSWNQYFCVTYDDDAYVVPIYDSLPHEKCAPGAEFKSVNGFTYEVVSAKDLTIKEGWELKV